ncbi:cytochrome c oxidase assembly protein [Coralloluteibacterium stylophorae]|uniref:Cytochrome c oxidase assembly protein n=1 Tax=Coralloluteibacterium stylophorae TaxID=1776034 RepID=A0A8J7VUB6_9GAMM|nr:cytochrome c oxidase assembly protein [Coralloluteibacterium stylophorae]MBS7455596.1 cytochrome c oxidase assembly protein [Coralloluteibacterium stylophorae]
MNQHAHAAAPDAAAALFVLLVVVPLLALGGYLVLVLRERRAGRWSRWRTAAFAGGVLLVVAVMAGPVAAWAHHDLRGHMLQHLVLGMFAPLGLVLGAPGTLLLRALPAVAARRVVGFFGAPPLRVLVHPLTALLLDIGGMYVLYLTPLFALGMSDPVLHVLLHVHFLVSGYLFAWAIAGPDPAPHRPGAAMRLAVLFVGTAAHANLGKLMYGYGFPRGTGVGRAELESAAQWMYYGGDLAELLLTVAFFAAWFARRRRRDRGGAGPDLAPA